MNQNEKETADKRNKPKKKSFFVFFPSGLQKSKSKENQKRKENTPCRCGQGLSPTKVGMIDVRWLATTGLTAALQAELEAGATCRGMRTRPVQPESLAPVTLAK